MAQHQVLAAAVLYLDGVQQHRTSIIRYAGEIIVGAVDRVGPTWVGMHTTIPDSDLLDAVRNMTLAVAAWEESPHHTATLHVVTPEPSLS